MKKMRENIKFIQENSSNRLEELKWNSSKTTDASNIIQGITEQLTNEYQQKLNSIILYKINLLTQKALASNELALYEILSEMDVSNISKTVFELEMNGYSWELTHPQANLTFNDNVVRTTINVDDVKIKVTKHLFEV